MKRSIMAVFLVVMCALPATVSAELLQVWARADGGYLAGDSDLHYFQTNDVGPEYGFAVGAEVLAIDVFANANFHSDGSMFNMTGLGYHLDLIPVDAVAFGPIAQAAFFYAPTDVEGMEDDQGFIFRGGAFLEINFWRFFAIGAEGLAGYAVVTSDTDTGGIYQGSGYLKVKLGI